MLVEEHFGRRAYHQSRGMRESRVGDTSHPFLLRDIRHNTKKPRHSRIFSDPFTRGDEVFVCSKLDRQVSHVHGAAIPLQPETHLLRSHTLYCQHIEPQIAPPLMDLVTSFAHHPNLSPAGILTWLLSCGLRQSGEEAIDLDSLLYMLQEQGLSICPSASPLIITSGFQGSTSSW